MIVSKVERMVRVVAMSAVVAMASGAAVPTRALAQDAASQPEAGPVELNKVLDGMVSGLEKEMMGVVQAMPADKFNFAPSQSIFASGQKVNFSGVRTFAEQCTHVASANYYYFSQVSGTKPSVDVASLKNLKTKDEVVQALQASFAFAHQAVATLTPDNAMNPAGGGGQSGTRATMVAGGVAHGFDHYGQMVEYLRMNGQVPPASAK